MKHLFVGISLLALLGILMPSAQGEPDKNEAIVKEVLKLQEMGHQALKKGSLQGFLRIQRRIAELCRKLEGALGNEGRKETGKGESWRQDCIAVLHKVGMQYHKWGKEADNRGDEGLLGRMKEGLGQIRKVAAYISKADREGMKKLLPTLEKGLDNIERQLVEAKEKGDRSRVKRAQWVLEHWRVLFKVARRSVSQEERRRESRHEEGRRKKEGARERGHQDQDWERGHQDRDRDQRKKQFNRETIEKARSHLKKTAKEMKGWMKDLLENDEDKAAEEIEEGIEHIGRFRTALKEVRGPDQLHKLCKELSQAIDRLETSVHKARREGNQHQVRLAGWVLERLVQTHKMLQGAMKGGEQARRGGGEPLIRRKALELLGQVQKMLLKLMERYHRQGSKEEAIEFRKAHAEVSEFAKRLQKARHGEELVRLYKELSKDLEKLKKATHEARRNGNEEQEEILGWLLRKATEVAGLMKKELHSPSKSEHDKQAKAKHRGDDMTREVKTLRREIQELREKMKYVLKALEKMKDRRR